MAEVASHGRFRWFGHLGEAVLDLWENQNLTYFDYFFGGQYKLGESIGTRGGVKPPTPDKSSTGVGMIWCRPVGMLRWLVRNVGAGAGECVNDDMKLLGLQPELTVFIHGYMEGLHIL